MIRPMFEFLDCWNLYFGFEFRSMDFGFAFLFLDSGFYDLDLRLVNINYGAAIFLSRHSQ